jgi:hypothetical protein
VVGAASCAAQNLRSGRRVPFNFFGQVVHLFGRQFDACLRQTFLENVAYVILHVAQADLMTDVFGNTLGGLGMVHLPGAIVVVKRRASRISSGFTHNLWWPVGMEPSMTQTEEQIVMEVAAAEILSAPPNSRTQGMPVQGPPAVLDGSRSPVGHVG